MAIAFRSLTSTTYAIRTNTVLTAPAGLVDGDILIATIVIGRDAADIDTFDPVPPAGWAAFGTATKIGDASTFTGKLHIWWKRASSESGSYTFTHNSVNTQGLIKAYSGCLASGTPLGATANATGSGTISTGTSITTTAANSYLLYEAHNWTGTARLPASGMTERFDNLLYSADELIAAASSTGTRVQNPNGNSGGGDVWAVRMVELLAATTAGPASWVYVGRGTSVESATTTHTLTEPAGVAAGDLLVACIVSRVSVATSITLPAGWTRVGEQLSTSISTSSTAARPSGTMAYIVRGASAPSFTFTHPIAPVPALGRVVAYRPVDQTTPLDVGGSGQTALNVTAVSVTGITTTVANTLIVAAALGGQEAAWSGFGTTDPATNSGTTADSVLDPVSGQWLERSDIQTTSNNDTSLAILDAVKPTAGATGNFTATASIAAGHAVIAGAFKPGAAVEPGFDVLETEGGDWRETEAGVVRIIDRTSVGALNATLASSALSSAGKVLVRGTLTATLGAATLGATGKVTVRGTAAGTALPAVLVATGTVVNKVYSGTLAATLDPATLSAIGTVSGGLVGPDRDGSRETELGDWRETEDGTIRWIDITSIGTLAATLGDVTGTLTGKVTVRGTAAGTALPAVLVATGTVGKIVYSGSLSQTLASATLSATGTVGAVICSGSLSVTLANAVLVASGSVSTGGPPFEVVRETEQDDWRVAEDGVTLRIVEGLSTGSLATTLDQATLVATGLVTAGPLPPDQEGVRETEALDWRVTEDDLIRIVNVTYTGTLSVRLAPATLAASGTVAAGPVGPPLDGVRETEADDWRITEDGTIRLINSTVSGSLVTTLQDAGVLGIGMVGGFGRPDPADGSRQTEAEDWRETEDGIVRVIESFGEAGYIRVWNGTAWELRPVKVWTGSAWVRRQVQYWNGSAWTDA